MTQVDEEVYTAKQFGERLESKRSPEVAQKHKHLAADNEDQIIGVSMGEVFKLAKEFIQMPINEVELLLESPIHEARVGAVSVVDWQARSKKTTNSGRKGLFDLYIRRHDRINNWDLVDRSALYVDGAKVVKELVWRTFAPITF